MNCEYVITGIGIVSPIGIGKSEFWDSILSSKSGIKDITISNAFSDISDTDKSIYGHKSMLGGEICHAALDNIFSDRRFRRAANISKYCIAASGLAIRDSGLDFSGWDPEKIGLTVGVTHGAMNYTREFHTALVREGALAASPMFFSDSVLNAPAGNASIAFNIKGASHTIAGGITSGIDAIDYAINVMRNNNLDICIAGGAEELDPLVMDSYAKFNLLSPNNRGKAGIKPFAYNRNGFIAGEGACMFVVEKKDSAVKRKANIYAGIYKIIPVKKDMALSTIVSEDFHNKSIYAVSCANGTGIDVVEAGILKALLASINKDYSKAFVGNIKPLTGECFAAGSAMQAAAAAMALYNGIMPPSTLTDGLIREMDWYRPNTKAENVKADIAIVTSIGFEGRGSLLVLKK